MIVPFYTSSSARAQAPLHLPHKFFDVKSFYKILPLLPIVIANLATTLLVLAPTCCLRAEIGRPRKRKKSCKQGEGFVKFCFVKKACTGDGGELECALDDVFMI